MNNVEFCNMLNEARNLAGITIVDLVVALKKSESVIRSILKARADFTMQKYLPLIQAIGGQLLLRNSDEIRRIKTPEDVCKWFNDITYSNTQSSNKLGELLGVSRQTISRIMKGGTIRLSIFLNMAKYYNYTISIEPLNDTNDCME